MLLELLKGPIARGTLRTSAVLGVRLIVLSGTLLLLARLFGPQGFGAFAGISALAIILGTLSTFGTHLVLLAEASRSFDARWDVLKYSITTTLIVGSLLTFAYVPLSRTLVGSGTISSVELFAFGITELILQPLIGLSAVQHQSKENAATSQLLVTLPLALRFVMAAALYVIQPNDPMVIFIFGCLGASIAGLLAATASLENAWPDLSNWRLPRVQELKRSASFAVLNLTAAGPGELDKALAARLLSLASAGLYSAGARIVGALTLPVFAMVYAALPRLFRSEMDQEHARRKLLVVFFGSAVVYGVGMGGCLWIAAPYIAWLFGDKYDGLGGAIRSLSLAAPAIALRLTCGAVLMARGSPWARVTFEVVGLISLTVAAFALTPGFGLAGMITAVVCAEWIMAAAGGWIVSMSGVSGPIGDRGEGA